MCGHIWPWPMLGLASAAAGNSGARQVMNPVQRRALKIGA